MKNPIAIVAAALMLLAAPAMAADLKFPELTGPVVDTVDEIPAEQEARIDAKIRAFRKETGHQLQVLTVADTQGRPITEYGIELLRTWGIGRAGVDDGIILIHALKSEAGRIRIEVGYGAEPYMTDAISSVIMNNTIIPAFKQKAFGDGIEQGVDDIIREARYTPEQRAEDQAKADREAARQAQVNRERFATFMTWTGVLAGAGVVGFGIWFAATAGRRRRRREAEALQRIADAEIRAAAQKVRAQARADEQERRRVEEARRIAERVAALAAMTPHDRERFLEKERADEEARRRELERRAAIQRQKDEDARIAREKRRAQEAREEEEEKRRGAVIYGGTYGGSSSDTSSNNSGSDTDWTGGGGSGGGGGATGDY
jgi:uncharacterized protein